MTPPSAQPPRSRPALPRRLLCWSVRVADARAAVRRSRYFKERWFWAGKSYAVINRELDKNRLGLIFHMVASCVVMCGVGALIAGVLQYVSGPPFGWSGYVAWIVPLLGMMLYFRVGPARAAAELVLADWTTQMRPDDPCLACGYPLAGAPTADDGCVECPECSAAWRIAESPAVPHREGGMLKPPGA